MVEPAITFPTIHINGSPALRLIEDHATARDAIRAAIKALSDAGPNARDYYPQGPRAFEVAASEHTHRLERLLSVERELATIIDEIQRQDDARRRR